MDTTKKCTLTALIITLCAAAAFPETNEIHGVKPEEAAPAGTLPFSAPTSAIPVAPIGRGDYVDLLGRYSGVEETQEVTKFLFQNVLVLGFGRRLLHSSATNTLERTIILAVQPADTNLIAAAADAGALIILRAPPRVTISTNAPMPIGDFWRPGEFQQLLGKGKQQREQNK
jgi:hypothetical protein